MQAQWKSGVVWSLLVLVTLALAAGQARGESEPEGCLVTITIKHGDTTIGTWTNGTGGGIAILIAEGVDYTYSATCNCAGHAVTLVTGQPGNPNPTTFHWRANSYTENDTTVEATCTSSQQQSIGWYTVVGGAIFPATVRIPPQKWVTRPVQIAPTLTAPRSVALDVIRAAGTAGSGWVDPSSVTQQTNAALWGEVQTSVGNANNMRLQLKGTSDVVVCYDAFTICDHPCNFLIDDPLQIADPAYYGFGVLTGWQAESGHTDFLGEVILHERVVYPGNIPNPPFLLPHPPAGAHYVPQLPDGFRGDILPGPRDPHFWRKNRVSNPPVANHFQTSQTYQFHCRRCMTDPGNPNNWADLRDYTILRKVEWVDAWATWGLRIEVTGPNTKGLPSIWFLYKIEQ